MASNPKDSELCSAIAERLTVSSAEACQLLGVSKSTLWKLKRSGKIPHVRCGRKVLYSVEVLQAFARGEIGNEQ